jgi:4-oxalomesaconate tautomerase
VNQATAGVRCMLMRGGTSKGAFFVEEDLPASPDERDDLLLRVVGSPDPRQIDGIGGAHPLTTKVAVVSASARDDVDVEYLFLQPSVEDESITARQNCGNILAAVGPFAIERGLVVASDATATVRILMRNTGGLATATFPVKAGRPVYDGDTSISGVPGTASEIRIEFADIAGSSTGALLPTGHPLDHVDGVAVTMVDNGMPVVMLAAAAVGLSGYESCAELEEDTVLRTRLEALRLAAGRLMNLGDVAATTIPKMTLVAPPRDGGSIATRSFIPHRCHDAIGVLAAVSVASACRLPGTVCDGLAHLDPASPLVRIEHPTGSFDATVELEPGDPGTIRHAGIIRTARKLMDGMVYPRSG